MGFPKPYPIYFLNRAFLPIDIPSSKQDQARWIGMHCAPPGVGFGVSGLRFAHGVGFRGLGVWGSVSGLGFGVYIR